jgi:hypothetical protein
MNFWKKSTASAVVLALTMGTGTIGASAQDAACSCAVGNAAGTVESTRGLVLISQPTGFTVAGAGLPVGPGSRIVVGAQAEVVISFGGQCERRITENNDITLVVQDGNLCADVEDVAPRGATPVAAGAALGGLIGIGAALWVRENPKSP